MLTCRCSTFEQSRIECMIFPIFSQSRIECMLTETYPVSAQLSRIECIPRILLSVCAQSRIECMLTIAEEEPGVSCRQTLEGEVEFKLMGLGHLAARIVADNLEKVYQGMPLVVQRWFTLNNKAFHCLHTFNVVLCCAQVVFNDLLVISLCPVTCLSFQFVIHQRYIMRGDAFSDHILPLG
jgi:hypothetical protein